MKYKSTRGRSFQDSTYKTLLEGLSEDGGLYLPLDLPKIDIKDNDIKNFTYTDYAEKIIGEIFNDIDKEVLSEEIKLAYKSFDREVLPIKKLDSLYLMELYHGETFAFKDFALSLLPKLISRALEKENPDKKILILTATSGDTGSAALYGFKNVKNTKIIVFYPTKGISEIQKKQMVSVDGDNTYAVGVRGNFDDAQSALKEIFNDKEFKDYLRDKNYLLSSANSINIGRLVPQIVYYFYSYFTLVKRGEISNGDKVSVSVPTGNFGNILAAYMAKKMGLPIEDLICGSNKNKVLTDFINTGSYNANREFYTTNSPSMDILISSNLERFLYYELEEDPDKINNLMNKLKSSGAYSIDPALLNNIYGYSYNDQETLEEIKRVFDNYNYLIDPHTAIATAGARDYLKNKDTKVLVASTASPFKFAGSIVSALGETCSDEISAIDLVEDLTGIRAKNFKKLLNSEIKQKRQIEKSDIKEVIREILK
ncbi:threonine synthase [Peptoniphilus catoniae]|uniref:threonine synthase n=1 Tax=Peptoniphilus catoniae TaxID=1660341 RepID=UPI0010FE1559|nr:threonine synthase [Peptoniphilus catoniae]